MMKTSREFLKKKFRKALIYATAGGVIGFIFASTGSSKGGT